MHKDLTDDGRELYCGEIFPSGWMLASHIKMTTCTRTLFAECEALIKPEEDLETMVKALSKENQKLTKRKWQAASQRNFHQRSVGV